MLFSRGKTFNVLPQYKIKGNTFANFPQTGNNCFDTSIRLL